MSEYELQAHGQCAAGLAKCLVSRSSRPERLDGGQPAPPHRKRPRAPAAAQNPAQMPEIRCLELNALDVHHHIGKSGMHQDVSQDMHIGKRVHAMRLTTTRPRNGELLQGAGSKGAQEHQPARAQGSHALRQGVVDRVEPGQCHARKDEVDAVRRQRQSLGLADDIPMPGKPAWCTCSCAVKQAGNGIDRHHIGSAETPRQTPGHRAGAGPEIENAPRLDANTVETVEQCVSRALHDPCELGVAVAGAGKQATHRGSVECRRCSVPRGWPLCHG